MKIYCRHNLYSKSDKEIFDSLAGEDAWLKMQTQSVGGTDIIYWLKVLAQDYYSDGTPCYEVITADELLGDNSKVWMRKSSNYYELEDIQNQIVRPIDILTTDELYEIYKVV